MVTPSSQRTRQRTALCTPNVPAASSFNHFKSISGARILAHSGPAFVICSYRRPILPRRRPSRSERNRTLETTMNAHDNNTRAVRALAELIEPLGLSLQDIGGSVNIFGFDPIFPSALRLGEAFSIAAMAAADSTPFDAMPRSFHMLRARERRTRIPSSPSTPEIATHCRI